MAEYFQEMTRELGEAPDEQRIARYFMDIGLFEDYFTRDWPRIREYVESWQLQVGEQNEPKEPQPASPEAIKNLTTIVIQTEGKECSICLMDYKKNDVVKAMPCKHIFHEICILTWLSEKNTCPFCRHRIPAKTY